MNEEKKYALKVQFEDGWLYVCEGPLDELRVMTMTLDKANEMAEIWRLDGHEEAVEVVEYNS